MVAWQTCIKLRYPKAYNSPCACEWCTKLGHPTANTSCSSIESYVHFGLARRGLASTTGTDARRHSGPVADRLHHPLMWIDRWNNIDKVTQVEWQSQSANGSGVGIMLACAQSPTVARHTHRTQRRNHWQPSPPRFLMLLCSSIDSSGIPRGRWLR